MADPVLVQDRERLPDELCVAAFEAVVVLYRCGGVLGPASVYVQLPSALTNVAQFAGAVNVLRRSAPGCAHGAMSSTGDDRASSSGLLVNAREEAHAGGRERGRAGQIGGAMALYMVRFSYTPESWAALVKSPENREETVRRMLKESGASLEHIWYAFGDEDGFALIEAPDNVTAAAISLAITSTGRSRRSRPPSC